MTDLDTRRKIETTLKLFSSGHIFQSSLALFAASVYNTSRQNPFIKKTTHMYKILAQIDKHK